MKKALLFVFTLSGLSALSKKIFREYHYVQMSKTWAEAQSYCRETFSDLATVRTTDENNRLKSVLVGHSETFAWIGLYDDLTRWKWSLEYSDFINDTDFSNWSPPHPITINSRSSCIKMSTDGLWYTSLCNVHQPSVCYNEQDPSRYILVDTEMHWAQARNFCRSNYTDLASVTDITENNQISKLISKQTWIGLHRRSWSHWSDRSRPSPLNWNEGQPDGIGESEGMCAVVKTTTGTWWDVNCNAKHYFICQKVHIPQKRVLPMKFQSEADLTDPALQQQILEQLHAKLEEHGLSDFKLRWVEVDGQTFHKEQKWKKEEGSGG